MIVVRNEFKIDPTSMKEAKELVVQMAKLIAKQGPKYRVMTDAIGEFYTLVLEGEHENLQQFESLMAESAGDSEWQELYGRVRPMIVGGHREVYTLLG